MSTQDADLDPQPEVVIRCQGNRAVRVRLFDRVNIDDDCVHYSVEVSAPQLDARADEVVAWIWDAALPNFLDELASDFRGWTGDRHWQTNDRDLSINATFGAGGHVGLTWTLRPWPRAAGGWKASVTTWLEAGEQMNALAVDVRHFLTPPNPSQNGAT